MDQIIAAIRQMISATDEEMEGLLRECYPKKYKKHAIISTPGKAANEVFFITSGIIRVIITDNTGIDHTIHFALENQFIADYSSFLLQSPALYTLQAIEESEVVVMPRTAIEWGYKHLQQGDRLGRLIAEFYFIYQDHRVKNMYAWTPKERYDHISQVFPNIHNRVPQHMIASYLGITPVHLSRLKKSARRKV